MDPHTEQTRYGELTDMPYGHALGTDPEKVGCHGSLREGKQRFQRLQSYKQTIGSLQLWHPVGVTQRLALHNTPIYMHCIYDPPSVSHLHLRAYKDHCRTCFPTCTGRVDHKFPIRFPSKFLHSLFHPTRQRGFEKKKKTAPTEHLITLPEPQVLPRRTVGA